MHGISNVNIEIDNLEMISFETHLQKITAMIKIEKTIMKEALKLRDYGDMGRRRSRYC